LIKIEEKITEGQRLTNKQRNKKTGYFKNKRDERITKIKDEIKQLQRDFKELDFEEIYSRFVELRTRE